MITNLGTATGVLAAASPDNWYSVKVNSPQTLNLNLQAAFGTPSMTLVDPSGKQVASSGGATRTKTAGSTLPLPPAPTSWMSTAAAMPATP